jgi:MoxR-like ATPase
MLWMLKASQALAAISGRSYVVPDDIKRLAVPVFAHRILTQTGYGAADKASEIVGGIVGAVAVPTEDPTADMLK